MNKDVIITVLGGVCIFLLFKQYGNKIPQLASASSSDVVEEAGIDDAECREAVATIVAEKLKAMKFVNQKDKDSAKTRIFNEELTKCMNS